MKETSINLRIDRQTRDALERLAKTDKRKLSAYVALVLEQHVAVSVKRAKHGDVEVRTTTSPPPLNLPPGIVTTHVIAPPANAARKVKQ